MTIAEFLLARIAEDEREVRHVPEWSCTNSARGEGWGTRGDCPLCDAYQFDGAEDVTEQAMFDHLEEVHRRSRVLAECEAKRRIVGLHRPGGEHEPDSCTLCQWDIDCEAPRASHQPGSGAFPCDTLRALASVYADHPELDPAWRTA